ncbi:flippase [Proteus mirabilis]|uniref:flippase n=1 Tax=Proteus mirabilis TaxID=584 RepID=UPI0018C645CF|nr:flippase [Proteus mirabilis]MBG6001330.1 flippase [Proteus mirabilis]
MDKKIITNILSMFSIQGVNYLIPLIMIPYLVRTLGMDGFGKYSIIIAIIQYLVIITDYGFNLSASKEIALNIGDKKKISEIFFSIILSKIIIATFLFLFLFLFLLSTNKVTTEYNLFISGIGIVIGTSFFPVWLFQGYEDMHWIAISNLIAKLSGLILVFLIVKNKEDLVFAIMIQSIVSMIASFIAFTKAFLGKYIHFVKPSLSMLIKQLRSGWSIFLSTLFVSMYTTSIPLILGYTSGAESAGIYNAADKLKYALQGIIGPVSQAIYPKTNRLMLSSIKQALRFVIIIAIPLVLFITIGSLIVYIYAEQIISIAFGEQNLLSTNVLRIIIWIPPIVAIANILGVQIILPLGKNKYFGLIYVSMGVIGLPLIYIASSLYSYIGVSIASLIIELLITFSFFIIVTKSIRVKL